MALVIHLKFSSDQQVFLLGQLF